MAKIEFFGLYRLEYKMSSITLDVTSVENLFDTLASISTAHTAKELRDSIVIVNDVNICKLKKYKTPLKDSDVVWIMSPASGG